MNILLLKYDNTDNIGDVIQTLAVAQHIQKYDGFIERDHMNSYDGEECIVVMNGWFSHEPQNWPPSPKITPIFFGFHMTSQAAALYSEHKEYFRRFQPIGCRDLGTAEIIRGWGVEAYVSGCATMTFSERPEAPANPKVVLVDVPRQHFDRRERANFAYESHIMPAHWSHLSQDAKIDTAKALLELYRSEAGTVVTSRIHCAMPCFAMGIPTVYSGIVEYRTALINDIGIPSYAFSKFRRMKAGALPFKAPNYKERKQAIAADLRKRLELAGVPLAPWRP